MLNKTKKEVQEELDLLSTMLESLVDLLEKKGVLTQLNGKSKSRPKKTPSCMTLRTGGQFAKGFG